MSSRSGVMIRRPRPAPRSLLGRRIPRLGLLAAALAASGCWVFVVSGPSTVAVGETVTYVLSLGANQSADPELLAEVPEGWQLESATYDAILGGQPVSGDAIAVDGFPFCEFVLGEARPGFQRFRLQPADPLTAGVGDTATVTLVFLVDSQPAGEFNLFFVLGGFATGGVDCSEAEGLTVNRRGPRSLTLLQTLFDDQDGNDGLGGARQAVLSPQGGHLYVAGEDDQAVAAFTRDPATGELAFVEAEIDGVGGVDGLDRPQGVAPSPDGRHLYVVGPGAVAAFARDPASGELTFIERLLDDADNLALSPDGRHLYAAAAGGLTVYARDEESGELTFVASEIAGGRIALSPDGRHLYAAIHGPGRIETFGRDETSGRLTFLDITGVEGVHQVAVSPGGRHLYAVGDELQALTLFDRDPVSGLLDFVEAEIDPTGDGILVTLQALAISPDGRQVVTTGRHATVIWERQPISGRLTRAEVLWAGNLPVEGLEGPGVLAFAPGSRHLYAVAPASDAVLALGTAVLFTDGFESGTPAAWSSVVP